MLTLKEVKRMRRWEAAEDALETMASDIQHCLEVNQAQMPVSKADMNRLRRIAKLIRTNI